jgi:hypothetical protein
MKKFALKSKLADQLQRLLAILPEELFSPVPLSQAGQAKNKISLGALCLCGESANASAKPFAQDWREGN